jgi:hypothetical protein
MPAEVDMIGMGTALEYVSSTVTWDGTTNVPTGTWTSVGSIMEVSIPEESVDDVETTSMGITNYTRTFKAGLSDPGEVTFTVKYLDTTHDTLRGLLRTTKAWRIKHNDASGYGFDGYLKTLGGEAPIDNLVTVSGTIKLTNKVIDLDAA